MTHLTELQCSMYADGALGEDEIAPLLSHFESCPECQARISAMTMESQLIGETLSLDVAMSIPAFQRPATLVSFVIVAGVIAVFAGFCITVWQSFWQLQNAGLSAEVFSWFASFHVSDGIGFIVSTVLFIFEEGSSMIDVMFEFVIYGLLFAVITGLLFSRRQFQGAVSLCFAVMIFSSLFSSPSANALEYRVDDEMFTVEVNETINDSLVVAGNTIIINGTINGDLIVFGRRVIVNGTVAGNLIVFTESVTLSGRVEGSVLGFANALEMSDALIGSNLWGFSNTLSINSASSIAGNATVFGNTASIAGEIARDLTGFGQSIELSGRVDEDIEAFAERVTLIGDAYVGGGVRFHSDDADGFQQSPSAVVIGDVDILVEPGAVVRNRFARGGFYVAQIIRLLTAFLAGLALFWFFPGLRNVSLSAGTEGFKTGGIGLLALIFLPVLMGIAAITVIGLPFSLIGLFAWLLGLYFAKIVIASIIGRLIMASSEKRNNHALCFLIGLVIVITAVNLPWVGGWLSFVMLIVGLGLIVQQVLGYSSSLEAK